MCSQFFTNDKGIRKLEHKKCAVSYDSWDTSSPSDAQISINMD